MNLIVGRLEELEIIKNTLNSKEAELVAIWGRRRIDKTYLIRNCIQNLNLTSKTTYLEKLFL